MDTNPFAGNEAFVRACVAQGREADFSKQTGFDRENKPKISAEFLRRMMLGLEKDEQGNTAKILLPGVRVRGAFVEGQLNLADCAGASGAGLPALALDLCDLPFGLDLASARLARLSLQESRIGRVWADCLRLDGDLDFRLASPAPKSIGGNDDFFIAMRAARIGGDVVGLAAKLVGVVFGGTRRVAMILQSSEIGGVVALRSEGGHRFEAHGEVSLLGSRIGGNLELNGALFSNPGGIALIVQSAQIGGDVQMRVKENMRFESIGEVTLNGARIGGNIDCAGAKLSNEGGLAFLGANAVVGGDVLMRLRGDVPFEAKGEISLAGIQVGQDIEFSGADLHNANGRAFNLRTGRISGQLLAINNRIEGAVSMAGTRIGRLYDDPDTGWGDPKGKCQIDLNEISIEMIGFPHGIKRPFWKARSRWLRRNIGTLGETKMATFSNQPWRQVAAAFERAGLHGEARRIRRKEQAEANNHRFFLQRPVVWLVGEQMFGFGLSLARATFTTVAFCALGALGVIAMNERGAFVATQLPDKPEIACTQAQPTLYALDVMIPVLDLNQEHVCEPGRAPGDHQLFEGFAHPFGDDRFLEEIALWRWAIALYALFGAAVVGFALLTYTGVFKPRAEP